MKKPTPEEFVKVWQEAESMKEAAEKLGMSKSAASNRASYYRKRGVNLKSFVRGGHRPPLNVAALNEFIESLAAQNQTPQPPEQSP